MEDSNLIACLYSADGDPRAEAAIRMRENSGRYIPAPRPSASEYGSRETTVSSEGDNEKNNDGLLFQPRLQLTFNPGPKAGQGFVIGHDRNRCDIVLPRLDKISRHHCVLTFDTKRRLILRSLSTNGTKVEYDGKGGEKRRTIVTKNNKGREKRHHFTWILSDDHIKGIKRIVIEIQKIKFRIIVAKHKAYPNLYNDYVDQFLREANADDELPFGALGIQSTTSTAQPTGAHTPTPQTPIYINHERLGSGQFSIVYRVWDVSTGSVYASKEFFNMKESQWRKEAAIMSQVLHLSNKHIVQFVALIERPSPQLILEYLPLGNLQDQHRRQPFSNQESLTILCQSLSALTSIHESNIVHRDIKPENILVQSRQPLHIKFADFGLSKATLDLKTVCGTHLYAAPEIYTSSGSYYTNACDIWSLGVVVFQYAYGPLPHQRDVGLRWCEIIVEWVNDCESDDLIDFLATAILVLQPEMRFPARRCWEWAIQFSATSQNRCPTPTQASYSERDCSKEIPRLYQATPSATPTEVATFVAIEALRNYKPSMQEANTALSQSTKDHDLIGYDTEKQDLEDQRSLVSSSNEGRTRVRKTRKMKRTTDSVPLPRERRSNTPTYSTRHSSSTVQRSKRARLEERGQGPQYLRSVDGTDIFGSCWLRDPNCVGSDIAALGDDVNEEGSRLSNWTSFHSENPISASAVQPHSDAGVIHPHKEDGKVQPHDIHQSIEAVQEIRFRPASSLICASDLIKASSKRYWPASLILAPYKSLIHITNKAFVSYPDGLDLASRLKLPTERLRDAMNEKVSRISIEIPLDEAEAIDKAAALIVHIWPSKSLINVTNLSAIRGCSRDRLLNILEAGAIRFIHCKAYGMQGSYTSYHDGLCLATALGFSEDRLGQIRNAIGEGWLGPMVYVQHEPNFDYAAAKSKMAAKKAAEREIDIRGHVRLEEFLLPCDETPSFACSPIGESKKLSRKGGGENLDDRYYKGLDLEDEELGFYEHSAL